MKLSRILAGVFVFVGIFIAAIYVGPKLWPERGEFIRDFQALTFGATESEVKNLFGRDPNFIYHYQGYDVFYYEGHSPFAIKYNPGGATIVRSVNSTADLPEIYGAAQLAFDERDELVAYSLIGESYNVESVKGAFKGSDFSVLGEDFRLLK